MEPRHERRTSDRAIVGADHSIRFQVKGHVFMNVRITNVSPTGCFAMVSHRDAGLFGQGTLLEQLTFEHPDLAGGPIMAKVMYTLGGEDRQSVLDFMGVGIHFLDMTPETRLTLDRFVATSLGDRP